MVLARSRRGVGLLAVLVVTLSCAGIVSAQEPYPSRPVRIIVPVPPGAGNDILARILADRLAERMGQRFLVENRPGGGGLLGAELAARAAPDGHTITVQPNALVIAPSMVSRSPVDPVRDFAPVVLVASVPMLLAVNPAIGVSTVREFIAHVRSSARGVDFASAGTGSPQHLIGEIFRRAAAIELVHVPYRGGAPAVADAVAGHLKVIVMGLPGIAAPLKSGALIPVAVAAQSRSPQLPDVPTFAEAGIPGVDVEGWFGILAPALTPASVIDRLNKEINAVIASADGRKRLIESGYDIIGGTAEAFAHVIRRDYERFGKIITEAGIKAE